MRARISRNLSYANVAATLALFVALGGGAYAAIKLPANSVGTKQIKNKAVTLGKIAPSAQRALKGQRGDRGATGAAATRLWAVVNADGTLSRGSTGVSSAQDPSPSMAYQVKFPRSVAGCAWLVTVGDPSYKTYLGPATVTTREGSHLVLGGGTVKQVADPDTVQVFVSNTDPPGDTARAFHIGVFC